MWWIILCVALLALVGYTIYKVDHWAFPDDEPEWLE